jgi:hypothetical protein
MTHAIALRSGEVIDVAVVVLFCGFVGFCFWWIRG